MLRRCWAKQAQCATTHSVLIAESTDRFQTSMSNLVRACFTHRRMRACMSPFIREAFTFTPGAAVLQDAKVALAKAEEAAGDFEGAVNVGSASRQVHQIENLLRIVVFTLGHVRSTIWMDGITIRFRRPTPISVRTGCIWLEKSWELCLRTECRHNSTVQRHKSSMSAGSRH